MTNGTITILASIAFLIFCIVLSLVVLCIGLADFGCRVIGSIVRRPSLGSQDALWTARETGP